MGSYKSVFDAGELEHLHGGTQNVQHYDII